MAMNAASLTDEFRVYFSRVKPVYRELFNMAHAICGNYEMAEYALQCAILECYQKSGRIKSRVGFRENLRNILMRIAVGQSLLLDGIELTWDDLRADAIDGAQGDFILTMASEESLDARRILMLRYGCGIRPGQIAKLMNTAPAQVSRTLERFEKRISRRLPLRERARVENRIAQTARAQLTAPTAGTPDVGTVYRSFEAEAMQVTKPRGRISRIVSAVITGILVLFCAVIFWVIMVLLQPPEMETPAQNNSSLAQSAQVEETDAFATVEPVSTALPVLDSITVPPEAASIEETEPTPASTGSGTFFDLR